MTRRDPHRREAILDAAARLVSERGYAAVSMADIGREAGITASAIYWHFPGKVQLLVELFDACLDRLLAEQGDALERLDRTPDALREITRLQVRFVVDERAFARVYYQEARLLPPEELARLRGKQRQYVDAWSGLLAELRPELPTSEAEDLVHAAIGAIQSGLVHRSATAGRHDAVLLGAALALQGFS